MPLHTPISKFYFGDVELHDTSGFEFRKKTCRERNPSGSEYEMARFNPSDIESVISAAHYVGANDVEKRDIDSYFRSIGAA
jgi:hypothetical protein